MNRNAKLAKKFFEQRMLDRARAELEANRAKRKKRGLLSKFKKGAD